MTLSPDHIPTIRKAVAEVLRANHQDRLASQCERGEWDRSISVQGATLAVERVLDEMFK